MQQLEALARNQGEGNHRQTTEDQYPKRKLNIRHLHVTPVHRDDIERIEQRRNHDEGETRRTQFFIAVALIEQADTANRQKDGNGRGPSNLLVEKNGHQYRRHNRVNEEQGTRNASRHIMETEIERARREREHHSQHRQSNGVPPLDFKAFPLPKHHNGKHRNRQKITVNQHRTRAEPIAIELERSQWIGTITHGGDDSSRKSFHFITASHIDIFLFRTAKLRQIIGID